jgi:hypothetical protein
MWFMYSYNYCRKARYAIAHISPGHPHRHQLTLAVALDQRVDRLRSPSKSRHSVAAQYRRSGPTSTKLHRSKKAPPINAHPFRDVPSIFSGLFMLGKFDSSVYLPSLTIVLHRVERDYDYPWSVVTGISTRSVHSCRRGTLGGSGLPPRSIGVPPQNSRRRDPRVASRAETSRIRR